MGDRVASEAQRARLAEAIEKTAASSEMMADEVYVQLIKQLTDNPSTASVRKGWDLMLCICHKAAPSLQFYPFLTAFLVRAAAKLDAVSGIHADLQLIVKQCVADA